MLKDTMVILCVFNAIQILKIFHLGNYFELTKLWPTQINCS